MLQRYRWCCCALIVTALFTPALDVLNSWLLNPFTGRRRVVAATAIIVCRGSERQHLRVARSCINPSVPCYRPSPEADR